MNASALPAETFSVRLGPPDVHRLLTHGTLAVGREVTSRGASLVVNGAAWAAMAFGMGVCLYLYDRVPEARSLLVLASVTLLGGFVAAKAWWIRWNGRLLQGLVHDASWLTREQTVTVDDDGVSVWSDGYRTWYDWSLFTRLQENADALVLGSGGQPTVVVPKTTGVSEARLAWIRQRIG